MTDNNKKNNQEVFINHTNHPSSKWSPAQKAAAQAYGEIVDLPFPTIPAMATEEDVAAMVDETLRHILTLAPSAVLCQGEFTYSYLLIHQLLQHGLTVLSACSERIVKEYTDKEGKSQKQATFEFCKFRKYQETCATGSNRVT